MKKKKKESPGLSPSPQKFYSIVYLNILIPKKSFWREMGSIKQPLNFWRTIALWEMLRWINPTKVKNKIRSIANIWMIILKILLNWLKDQTKQCRGKEKYLFFSGSLSESRVLGTKGTLRLYQQDRGKWTHFLSNSCESVSLLKSEIIFLQQRCVYPASPGPGLTI